MVGTLLIDLLIVLVFIGPQLMVRLALYWARRGKYETALSATRYSFFPREANTRLRAIILCDMGLTTKAKELMQSRAFDSSGNFILGRPELLIYTLANLQEQNFEEAEKVLNAAAGSQQPVGAYHFYLAELLLSQRKDLNRASELIMLLRRNWRISDSPVRRRCIASQVSALGTWLLALEGQREESEEQIETLLRTLPPRSEREVAKINILIGEIRFALGDVNGAKICFAGAAALDPDGANAGIARRRLAEVSNNAAQTFEFPEAPSSSM